MQTVDLFPTMLKIAGIEVPQYTQGKDLMAWVNSGAREPLHDCIYAQVGDYHGTLKTTLPVGTFEAGRRSSLVQGARTAEYSYLRDGQYGDEAYDLRKDPKELSNVLVSSTSSEPAWVTDMRGRVDQWEQRCVGLREWLGVIPGERGFDT